VLQVYHLVYNLLQPTQANCITWYIPKACNPGPRLCLKPELIEKYLKDKIGFEGHIGEQDKMCIPCYRSHLAFLHEEKFDSTDSDLRQLVNSFTQQIPPMTNNESRRFAECSYYQNNSACGTRVAQSPCNSITFGSWFLH